MRLAINNSIAFGCALVLTTYSCQNAYSNSAQSGAKPIAQRVPHAAVTVAEWFSRFDQIMRANIITMQEKDQCDSLLMQAVMPNFDKANARNLLGGLATRYDRASGLFDQMPKLANTKQLYEGYAWYYAETAKLFRTYLKLIDNPMGLAATDESGNLLAPQLVEKKQQLLQVRQALVALDQKTRNENGITTPAIGM